ncbi:MAG: beta-propeller domain-containing protein [Methylococcales bacterium]
MNKNFIRYCFGLLVASTVISLQVHAGELVPVTADDTKAAVKIAYKLTNDKSAASNTFVSSEAIKLSFSVTVADKDVGQAGKLFVVARYNDSFFKLTATGGWQVWDLQLASLTGFKSKTLEKQEQVEVLSNQSLPAGEFLVFTGYQTDANEGVFYSAVPAAFAVFDKQSPALRRIVNKAVLTALFDRGGAGSKDTTGTSYSPAATTAPFAPVAASTNDSASTPPATSQTNIQELGVDESDRIKVNGDQLFALEKCAKDTAKQCLAAYRMVESPASTTALGSLELGNNTYQDTLYSAQTDAASNQKQIVYLGSSMQYPIFDFWFSPYYWQQDNKTVIKFIDVAQPGAMQVKSTITLNTALISSRVVDNVLYVVTRKNPHFYYPELDKPVVLGETAGPLTTAVAPDSVQVLPPKAVVVPLKKDIEELLPTIAFDGAAATPLVKADDCYMPARSSDKPVDNTLITITAIPLTAPAQYYSVCVAGSVDTFYMSTQAFYLATTRYYYPLSGNNFVYDSKLTEVTTEIHKFALAKAALTYKGSGTVPGHLGWDADKQPFRMGENNNVLKVATSLGDTWNDSSKTRVSVLQEDPSAKQLKEISFLDNLGKPGERLYAARFIGNRGYLVTFKTTDPLYILDFKDPTKPEVLGELKINGYSDYLHPIGDNYLLGIGKDAIPDTTSSANPFGVDRGAWYQGVKLSLFDVSSKEKLKEIDSVIIGKRGTQSAALQDHHALAWLASSSSKGTLSIPIELHNNLLPSSQLQNYTKDYYSLPSAYYDWTHTGLYTFTIDATATPAIKLNRRLIAEVNDPSIYNSYYGVGTYNDRAVIQGNSVHYVHDNRVLSASIGGE